LKSVPTLVPAAVAVAVTICAAACSSGGTSSSTSSASSASRPAVTASTASPANSAPATTKQTIVVGGIAPGTKPVCDMLTQNPELPGLIGVVNPPRSVFASGTVTNSLLGVSKVPGCQVGMNRNFTNGVVGWAFCKYQDPANLSDGGPIWGTSNVYTVAALRSGVFLVAGPTTAIVIGEFSGGNPGKSVMLPAIQAASRIFQQDGGCAASG
jgi:hypothetical protein